MRIVVLDEFGMTEENVGRLEARGDVRVYRESPADPDEVVRRAGDAEVVLSSWARFDDYVLARLPDLQLLSIGSTGLDMVDVATATRRGVAVCHVPSYATNAVAELALGLMFAVLRKIPAADRDVRATGRLDWQAFGGGELRDKTLGVVGTGVIGRRVAHFGHCLGMDLLGADLAPSDEMVREFGMRYAPLPEVFAGSDVVTLHVPAAADGRPLVDRDLLRVMRAGAVIINTSRAQLVQQEDLYEALAGGVLAGAGLDVVDLECESGRMLLTLDNVVFTPHIGFNTPEAAGALTAIATENVVQFLGGAPQNVVNPEVLPGSSGRTG
jgi:phosphoglycerate dehydrogenase-like enzyme